MSLNARTADAERKAGKAMLNGRHIELNQDFLTAFNTIENTDQNVFITGKAGTGKSTFLEYLRANTAKSIVVLAPTGVAALNVHGQTIHSFFKFKPNITLDTVRVLPNSSRQDIYKNLNLIVIDEISMVRADLLDCIDKFLRLNRNQNSRPFGGVQMVFIGDLYQLPPVVKYNERKLFSSMYKSPYFFDAKSFEALQMQFIELQKNYRQSDAKFIAVLNAIRSNSINEQHLDMINKRFDPDFTPPEGSRYVTLATTNSIADRINLKELEKLKSPKYVYTAEVKGDIEDNSFPNDKELILKLGTQVMLLNNDPDGRWVNGSIGIVKEIIKGARADAIIIELADGGVVNVLPFTWDVFRFSFDKKEMKIKSEQVGSFTQYPIMLAWAITIHKSQGKTFDKVIIDIGKGTFVAGQLYVALSRCTTMEGIVLRSRIEERHVFKNWRVVKFMTQYQYRQSDAELSLDDKVSLLVSAMRRKAYVSITYLKSNDEKSSRSILPMFVGRMEYKGKEYLGVKALDSKSGGERNFSIEKILSISKDQGSKSSL